MNVAAYLRRINYHGATEATAETLRGLHLAHLLAVPFENLDIHLGREIVLDAARVAAKVVERRRGGFCYELNGAFAGLLTALSFDVKMLAAGVARADGSFGPLFDHMALLVQLAEPWLADVGFGDSFREPLRLDDEGEQAQGLSAYRVRRDGEQRVLERRNGDGAWQPQYRFTMQPYEYGDYAEMCRYHQTSPQSHFTQKRVCTRATPEGRVTLTNNRLITTMGSDRHERELADESEIAAVLRNHFGVVL
ncbi:MAG TPA: arylamine N-acetyltransferase [Blastocatellia bacterium]|nr:arylamine N-acetyltransferase [Blastocatellia bacterium]